VQLGLHGDCDDLFFDLTGRRLYASCGEGFIDVFSLTDATSSGRRNSSRRAPGPHVFRDGRRLYLAVPRQVTTSRSAVLSGGAEAMIGRRVAVPRGSTSAQARMVGGNVKTAPCPRLMR